MAQTSSNEIFSVFPFWRTEYWKILISLGQTCRPLWLRFFHSFPNNFQYNFLDFLPDNFLDFFRCFFQGVLLDSTKIVLASSWTAYLTSTLTSCSSSALSPTSSSNSSKALPKTGLNSNSRCKMLWKILNSLQPWEEGSQSHLCKATLFDYLPLIEDEAQIVKDTLESGLGRKMAVHCSVRLIMAPWSLLLPRSPAACTG